MSVQNNDDMSMEEILSSIRKYVSTTNDQPFGAADTPKSTAKVIKLSEDSSEVEHDVVAPRLETPAKSHPSPFSKLQEAKKLTEKDSVIMLCLRDIVSEWLTNNPEFVEKAIHKAVKKRIRKLIPF